MYILSQKLKHLKTNLKEWKKESLVMCTVMLQLLNMNYKNIHNQIDVDGLTDNLLNQQKLAQIHLDLALDRQEAFCKEKAKIKWNLEGDRNISLTHRLCP